MNTLTSLGEEQRIVIFPVLAPADVSQIASTAFEDELTKAGHVFISSREVTAQIVQDDLLDDYKKFKEAYESLGILDDSFLGKFSSLGSHYLFINVTDWAP